MPMYGRFVQFALPRIGQVLSAAVLYLNFLCLPFVACFAGSAPLAYFGIPLLLLILTGWLGRNPLGPGMIAECYLTGIYLVGDLVWLIACLAGGAALRGWKTLWMGGLLAWVLTALIMIWAYFRAVRLHTTTYRLTTKKKLPGGKLRILQISDLHPGGGAMDRSRIPELEQRIRDLHPDLIVLTGDIYDEYVSRENFDSFNAFFARLEAPGGKWFVFGNHDIFHHWKEPCYTRADLETAFAAAGIRVLEDVAVLTRLDGVPLRIVGRKDWLFTKRLRFAPAELLPGGPDEIYTIMLDHEPRELRADAEAGADLILSGHTHGGQIWPTGVAARLFRYNEVNRGAKRITPGCTAVVSCGTGTWGYKIRTEGRTELVVIEIQQTV
ncbi:MAG: metallophosphoesterase [Oscillospiraceae bacterium]|nr:metallophosphoesterase [Oscillospiraceae bacterium]